MVPLPVLWGLETDVNKYPGGSQHHGPALLGWGPVGFDVEDVDFTGF
jgi:hypothetical protein